MLTSRARYNEEYYYLLNQFFCAYYNQFSALMDYFPHPNYFISKQKIFL
ncbi:albumin-2 [Listeria innocua FSL S4-378]|nr:albumin-2 [Listeria innocua FSL S4-378]